MPDAGSGAALPDHASVVVIGGGAMGCSTLYHLAQAGITDAVLLERNTLTSGTTWHSAAQVRALRSSQNLTDLIRYSIDLYQRLAQETGQATGWINKGSISIATQPDRMTHIRRQMALASLFGVPAEAISAGQAKERWPLMNTEDVLGAVWSPEDGRVGPSDLCAALVKGARQHGAQIFENTAVVGIVTDSNRVTGLETSRGLLRCDALALCAGLWSRQLAQSANAAVPIWPCEHFYLVTKPFPGIDGNLPTLSDHDGHLYLRDDSGGMLVGCFEPRGKPVDPSFLGDDFAFRLLGEDWDHFEPMMLNALHRVPTLADAEIRMLLNGPESFTPDGAFMLGEAAETRGLFLGCGMNSVGIASAGGAGKALAQCIAQGHSSVDLHEVDAKRFPDCFQSAAALTERVPEVLGKHYEITYPGRQMQSARRLRLSPLHERWQAQGACFGQVFGWERPLYTGWSRPQPAALSFARPAWFDNVAAEVRQATTAAALFDQSTLGKLLVEGADAERFLNRVCTNNLSCADNRAVYALMLNARGGIESDLTVLRLASQRYRLYLGTAAVKRGLSWLRGQLRAGENVRFTDETEALAVIAVTGPASRAIAETINVPTLNALGYFQHGKFDIASARVRAVRLSYVGEAGWEFTCRCDDAPAVYDALFAAGARPAGGYAQTSMRIEKRFLAYGQDLDTDVTPHEANLTFAVDWNKDFVGRQALKKRLATGVESIVATLLLQQQAAVALGNEPVFRNGSIVGKTTSAAYGYRVDRPVALAYLPAEIVRHSGHAEVEIDIAGERFAARAFRAAAFDPQGLRMRATR